MRRAHAQELWDCITAYADAVGEVHGEGNSGEFHDAKQAVKLEKAMGESQDDLIESFTRLTGWKPVLEHDTWYVEKPGLVNS